MRFAAHGLVPNRGNGEEVPGHTKLEFNAAVRECLAGCYQTDIPISALAEYVDLLKQRDWTPSEIHKVEAAVTKILLAVVSKHERDDLVKRLVKPRADSLPALSSGSATGIPWPAPPTNNLQNDSVGPARS
jgi:hypothetical protein